MSNELLKRLGPLSRLAGIWEGKNGDDTAPSDDRGTENNRFRERMEFEPFGPVNNHEQELYGLRYKTTACRIGEPDPFHEELGYWLWDAKANQVMRCFMVPRGVTILAGGTVSPTDTRFTLSAKLGSPTYGICSNIFLDQEFKTIEYSLTIDSPDPTTLVYEEDTVLLIKGSPTPFHHIDKNRLTKI